MAFRKFRRRFSRRRRRSPETYTTPICFDCHNVYGDMPCSAPAVHAIRLMDMGMHKNTSSDTTEVASPSDKFLVVDGIKFQSEFSHDPFTTLGFPSCDPSPFGLTFILRIWEALVVLPFTQGTTGVPPYLPNLTTVLDQGGDLADRVLWKRISHLQISGSQSATGAGSFDNQVSTVFHQGHGPVVVKARVRLDDRHGLFYVQNYTHDIFGLGTLIDSCTADSSTNPCVIPVINDSWFKIFFHTRK